MAWRNLFDNLPIFWRNRTSRAFLLSFLVLLAMTALASSFFYREVKRVVREDAIKASLGQLQRIQTTLDQELQVIDTYMLRLALNPKILSLSRTEDVLQGSRIMEVRDAWLDLAKILPPTDMVAQLFVFLGSAHVILSPDTPYVRLSFFDRSFFELDGLSFAEWEKSALAGLHGQQFMPASLVALGGTDRLVVPYMRAFPGAEGTTPVSCVIAFLDVEKIRSILSPAILGSGWVEVNANGSVIARLSFGGFGPAPASFAASAPAGFHEQRIQGQDMAMFRVSSPASQWSLTAVMPLRVALARVFSVGRIFSAVMLGLLLLGVTAAYLLALWNTRPMRLLLQSLSERTGEIRTPLADEFEFIEQTLVSLVEKNRNLSDVVERQAPLNRQAFVDRLLKGELTAPEEIGSLSRETGLDIAADAFVVLLLRVNGYQGILSRAGLAALSLSKAAVRTTAEQKHAGRVVLHEVDLDKVAVLVLLGTEDRDACRRQTEAFCQMLRQTCRESYNISTTISAGSVVGSALEICNSFSEAKYSLGQQPSRMQSPDAVLWFDAVPLDCQGYYYPIEVEYRIITLTKAGDLASLGKLLDGISEENFARRRLSDAIARQLITELAGTLIKAGREVREIASGSPAGTQPGASLGLDLSADIPRIMDQVRAEFSLLCAEVNERKKSRNWRLKESIVRYIASSYTDPGMCLSSVSSKFNLNEMYLSQFFKEQVGENFHHYLERLRMEKARSLLSETDLSVNEVAAQVGYYSAATFRKALRRIDGISPLTLRLGRRLPASTGRPADSR